MLGWEVKSGEKFPTWFKQLCGKKPVTGAELGRAAGWGLSGTAHSAPGEWEMMSPPLPWGLCSPPTPALGQQWAPLSVAAVQALLSALITTNLWQPELCLGAWGGRIQFVPGSVIPCGQFVFYKSRVLFTCEEILGCLGVVLQQNNPLFPFSFSNSWCQSCQLFYTRPNAAPQLPIRLLCSFLPLSLVIAGFQISKVHIWSYLLCWSSSFLTSKGKVSF